MKIPFKTPLGLLSAVLLCAGLLSACGKNRENRNDMPGTMPDNTRTLSDTGMMPEDTMMGDTGMGPGGNGGTGTGTGSPGY